MKKISIYTPCYNEEKNVELCYEAIRDLMKNKLPSFDYEHIFGDNCSEDNTLNILKRLAKKDKKVKLIAYSRNFGAFNSYFNGLLASSGDGIIPFFPADLQDPPEIILKMVEKWESGFEVIYGRKIGREEGFIMRSLRQVFYTIVNKTSTINIPKNVGEFVLIDKKVQDALRQFDDYYPYLRGMIASCGYKYAFIDYIWRKRKYGKSTGNPLILLDNAINGIISFSNIPMRLCMIFGFSLSGLSLAYSIYSLISSIIYYQRITTPGIPLLITALFFFFGITLFFIGVLGEYISAIHFQVRKKPLVIEAERINF
jgi:glycosyltransferase involved in cell wall biosynthesis